MLRTLQIWTELSLACKFWYFTLISSKTKFTGCSSLLASLSQSTATSPAALGASLSLLPNFCTCFS